MSVAKRTRVSAALREAGRHTLVEDDIERHPRKLLKPGITQVNIGGQQVNVANIEGTATRDEP